MRGETWHHCDDCKDSVLARAAEFRMAKVTGTRRYGDRCRSNGPAVSRSTGSESVKVSKHCHPPYIVMVKEAILTLEEPRGSTIRKIATCVGDAYSDELSAKFRSSVQLAVRRGVKQGILEKTGGKGACARFKISKKVEKKVRVTLAKGFPILVSLQRLRCGHTAPTRPSALGFSPACKDNAELGGKLTLFPTQT